MTAATVSLLAQLAMHVGGLTVGVIVFTTLVTTGALDSLEKGVFRPGANWLAC